MRLKPCPFCGSKMSGRTEYEIDGETIMPVIYGGCVTAVVCSNCSARGPFSDIEDGICEQASKRAAQKRWNERAA